MIKLTNFMRKILIFIIGIVGVLVLAWLIYYIVGRATAPKTASPETKSPEQAVEEINGEPVATTTGQLKIISKESVFDYWIASSTQVIFYVTEAGKIAEINPDGQDTLLSEQQIGDLNFILSSPDSRKIIVAFGNQAQPQFSIFDLTNNSWTPLPLEIKSAAWSPEGKRIAVITSQNNQTNLTIIDVAKYFSTDAKQKKKPLK